MSTTQSLAPPARSIQTLPFAPRVCMWSIPDQTVNDVAFGTTPAVSFCMYGDGSAVNVYGTSAERGGIGICPVTHAGLVNRRIVASLSTASSRRKSRLVWSGAGGELLVL